MTVNKPELLSLMSWGTIFKSPPGDESQTINGLKKGVSNMLTIVQLQDGCYKVTIDYSVGGLTVHQEWTFRPAESNAEPNPNGERVVIKWNLE